jgi:uncharacterized protein YjbI with pentapeptide repeats
MATLSGANLSGANLTGANLTAANLAGANLAGANLTDALMFQIDFNHPFFAGAIFSGATMPDGSIHG